MAGINYDTCPMEGFDSKLKNITFACKYRNKYDFELRNTDAQGIYGERFRIPLTKSILRDNYL
jgi:hypothetical protein